MMKLLNYKLSTIVCEGSHHKVLTTSSLNQLDVIETIPIYCKVQTLNKEGPLKVKISFKDKQERDLKVFVSDKVQEPSDINCQYQFVNQNFISIMPKKQTQIGHNKTSKKESDFFQNEYLYFNFFSLRGCSISIKLKFAQDYDDLGNDNKKQKGYFIGQRSKKLKTILYEKIQSRIKEIQDNPYLIQELNEEIRDLKKQRKRRLSNYTTKNFIQENLSIPLRWEEFQFERKLKQTQQDQKIEKVKQAQQEIFEQHLQDKILKIQKWDMIREQREQDKEALMILKKEQRRTKKWNVLVKTCSFINLIAQSFHKTREEVRLLQKREKSAVRIQRVFKKYLLRKHKSREQRLKSNIKNCFNVVVTHKYEFVVKDCQDIIKSFLHQMSEFYSMKMLFLQFHKMIKQIQTNWKERLFLQKTKIDLLVIFWEKEKSIMMKYYFAKQKKNKKAKNTFNKISQIDSYTRDHILQTYFEMKKLNFTVSFFSAKKDALLNNQALKGSIDLMKKQIKDKQLYLFKEFKQDSKVIDSDIPENQTNLKDQQIEKKKTTVHSALKGHSEVKTDPKLKEKKEEIKQEIKTTQKIKEKDQLLFFSFVPTRIQMQFLIKKGMSAQKQLNA